MTSSIGIASSTVHQRGVTLVELMVSLVLGLIVVGGALSIVASNKSSYRTNEALSQVQESARMAFELLAREIRQAGATGCDNSGRVGSAIEASTDWWQGGVGMVGYDGAATDPAVTTGTAVATRVAGTDSIQLRGIRGTGHSVESHTAATATIKLSAASDIKVGDVLVVCDFDHATIVRATSYDATNKTLSHATSGTAPKNCTTGLGFPINCATPNVYTFGRNSLVSKFSAVDWFIGNNGRSTEGGRSLYRRRLSDTGTVLTEEIVAGVSGLELQYRIDGTDSFVDASSVGTSDWANVTAVSITLALDSADSNVSTSTASAGRLQRTFTNIVTLRNRVP